MTILRQAVQEAKARAVLYPTVENMRSYFNFAEFCNKSSWFICSNMEENFT